MNPFSKNFMKPTTQPLPVTHSAILTCHLTKKYFLFFLRLELPWKGVAGGDGVKMRVFLKRLPPTMWGKMLGHKSRNYQTAVCQCVSQTSKFAKKPVLYKLKRLI